MIEDDICPNCGELVPTLNPRTGWCAECSGDNNHCEHCGKEKDRIGKYCRSCVDEVWFKTHADEIESYLIKGWDLAKAIEFVKSDLRPTCIICKQPIPRAPKNSLFCERNSKCRRAKRSYKHQVSKGVPREKIIASLVELSK